MSGLEVAGLVLGAMPIVIWSLEHYNTTRDIWRRSRNKALLLDRMINALQGHRTLIEIDLQVLFRVAGVEDVEVSGFDASSCCEILVEPRTVNALFRYLGRLYHVYRNASIQSERILADIA